MSVTFAKVVQNTKHMTTSSNMFAKTMISETFRIESKDRSSAMSVLAIAWNNDAIMEKVGFHGSSNCVFVLYTDGTCIDAGHDVFELTHDSSHRWARGDLQKIQQDMLEKVENA
jgi:hypothetical protein